MSANKAPCQECKRRNIGCHELCGDYHVWKEFKAKETKALKDDDAWTHSKGNKVAYSGSNVGVLKVGGVF